MITVVNNSQISSNFAGQILTREVAEDIAKSGADICGENGEYHTFVFDGPLYLNPIEFEIGDIIKIDNYSIVPIL
jgi:diphthamide synthase (EF-2-diphthine--ammonia ligase)